MPRAQTAKNKKELNPYSVLQLVRWNSSHVSNWTSNL